MRQPPSIVQRQGNDKTRRQLVVVTSVVGGAGLAAAAVPFVASLTPSARARAEGGPVEVRLGQMAPGDSLAVAWRGQPVWIMKRSAEMVAALAHPNAGLLDPLSRRSEQPADCVNANRSVRPDLFVAVGLCTHLGCSPTLTLGDPALAAALHAPGGYVCACHGSRFDLAGRVVKNVPAPTNLVVPPHRFTSADALTIG